MCGRFTLTLPDFEQLTKLLGVTYDATLAARYRQRFNVVPSEEHWIMTQAVSERSGGRALLPARWGFGVKKLPLARGETVATQGLFKRAFGEHRCLVPVDGFFEWSGEKKDRRPHWFHARDRESQPGGLLLLGGIWAEGPKGLDFAILTTEANAVVRPVHDRMPVVIPANEVERWIAGSADEARALIEPAPPELLDEREVSKRVNSAANDDAACLDAATPVDTDAAQKKLF